MKPTITEFLKKHKPFIYSQIPFEMRGDEDFMQEIKMYIFEQYNKFDPSKGSATNWIKWRIKGIKSKIFYQRYRSLKNAPMRDSEDTLDSCCLSIPPVEYDDEIDKILEKVSNDECRHYIKSIYVDGLILDNLAKECNCSKQNVGEKIKRELKKLRAVLQSGSLNALLLD